MTARLINTWTWTNQPEHLMGIIIDILLYELINNNFTLSFSTLLWSIAYIDCWVIPISLAGNHSLADHLLCSLGRGVPWLHLWWTTRTGDVYHIQLVHDPTLVSIFTPEICPQVYVHVIQLVASSRPSASATRRHHAWSFSRLLLPLSGKLIPWSTIKLVLIE